MPANVLDWQKKKLGPGAGVDLDAPPDMDSTFEYMMYDTMFEWKVSPNEFLEYSEDIQSSMVAYLMVRRSREAFVNDFYDRKRKEKTK